MKVNQSSDHWNAAQSSSAASQRASEAAQGASSASTAARQTARSPSPSVAVSVSNQARTLEASRAQESAEVDQQKVEANRAAIREGTFSVNAEAIADKLLANAQEMLQRTTR